MRIIANRKILICFFLPGLCVWLLLAGCRSVPVSKSSIPAGIEKQAPKPQKVNVEKLTDAEILPASSLITTYNSRNFGSPGWRRVSMELINDGTVTRSFEIINLWRSYDGEVRILFLLQEPRGLSGTNYLLREWANKAPDMQVHLFLPAGERRVLAVAPSNFDQGLLGSDFSYNDVRMLLPISGYHYTVIGQGVLANEPVWVIETEPSEPQTRERVSWSTARLYLARKYPILLGADYYGPSTNVSELSILKQMRVESFEQTEGVWTATRMIMTGTDQRWTELTLKGANFNTDGIHTDLFSPEHLPLLAERVGRGWTPETSLLPNP